MREEIVLRWNRWLIGFLAGEYSVVCDARRRWQAAKCESAYLT